MEQLNLEDLTSKSCQIVTEVADFIRGEMGKVKTTEIIDKSWNSLVSYVDRTAEKKLVRGLKKLLPESVFLTEEETVAMEAGDFQWIIDPLDGTTNFLHQLPCFSISVALRFKEEIILGIVYEVNQNECFYAWKNGGAFLNGRKIEVTKTQNLNNSLIATGFPYYDYELMKPYLKVLEYFMRTTRGIRRFGSAAVDLAYVACGRFDTFFEYSLNAWDAAGGIILVQEAGGQVVDFKGGNDFLFGKTLIATNQGLSNEVLEIIRKEFG